MCKKEQEKQRKRQRDRMRARGFEGPATLQRGGVDTILKAYLYTHVLSQCGSQGALGGQSHRNIDQIDAVCKRAFALKDGIDDIKMQYFDLPSDESIVDK